MVPGGSFANAASVGAKTVKGPGPLSVSTSPAASSAVARVVNEPAATAVSTMSLAGMACACARLEAGSAEARVLAIRASANAGRARKRRGMGTTLLKGCGRGHRPAPSYTVCTEFAHSLYRDRAGKGGFLPEHGSRRG